jgi:hypothetical protein
MDLSDLRRQFRGRLSSLDNDAKRAFYPIARVGYAPFPIAMYAFATIDYFSSFWAGWNDRKNRPKSDKRSQKKRMADFLERYLGYPQKETQLAIDIWRHKLMHTGEPRPLKEGPTTYGWSIADRDSKHWKLVKLGRRRFRLHVGIFNLVQDLRTGVLGTNGYFNELKCSLALQHKARAFIKEAESYNFRLES